jgi:hypothetical protein
MFHKSIGRTCVAALPIILAMAAHAPVLAAGPTTFGPPTYNSTIGFDIAIEPEKKAFTVGFAGLEAVLDIPQRPPIVTRTFSLSLPVTAEPGTEIPLFFQGSFESSNGATGHLVVTINDQTTAINFTKPLEKTYVEEVKYKVGAGASELRMTIVLIVDRDSKANASALLSVMTIDSDVSKLKR